MSHSRLGMVLSPLLSTIFTVMLVHPPQWLAPPGAEQRQGTTLWKMEAASQEDTPPPSLHDRTIHNFPGTCPQGMGSSDTPAPQIVFEQMRQDLRTRIEAAGTPPQLTVGDTSLRVSGLLPQFYAGRAYEPAWSSEAGPGPQVDVLIDVLRDAGREGLRPSDYHMAPIEAMLTGVRSQQAQHTTLDPCQLVDLDLLLTDAFFRYGTHVQAGRMPPPTVDIAGEVNHAEDDLATVLQTALESSQLADVMRSLPPPHPGYARLRQALARYRAIEAKGGWPIVPEGPPLSKGARDERVVALRTRLILTGDLDPGLPHQRALFDEAMEHALRRFQRRHGLAVDGVVSPATRAVLNVPVKARVRQLELNMERWRWLPRELESRYILVNIANSTLEVVEDGRPVLRMRVIVGRPERRTPVLSARMTSLVLSPYWHVPPKIAIEDQLPLIRKDPAYLTRQGLTVLQGWGAETRAIDPHTIDWSRVTADTFPYRLRQDPGPRNALGRLKFMFPNRFQVYLHDTPSRALFAKPVRALSSGCIRLERPIDLAAYVLRDDPHWSREKILSAVERGTEHTVRLPEPIPIHLVYWTAWAHTDGAIQFHQDIYGDDQALENALRKEPLPREQRKNEDKAPQETSAEEV
jgi:murein L,D-transpeptidase YcbB/YkuD